MADEEYDLRRNAKMAGFWAMPRTFVDDGHVARMGASALAVYTCLCRYMDVDRRCYPSQATLSEKAGMSPRQVLRSIKVLRDLEYIILEQRGGPGSGTNHYRIPGAPDVIQQGTLFNEQAGPPAVKGKPSPAMEQAIPPELDSPEFRELWNDFIQHRVEQKKRMTPTAIRRAFQKMLPWGRDRAIAALKHSIANSYQGIFEDHNRPTGRRPRGSEIEGRDNAGVYVDIPDLADLRSGARAVAA